MEGVRLADEVGLDFFGFGEHHTRSMPVSAPVTLLAAAGAATSRIRLGSTVSVLGTDDPVRVYQQAATASAVSGGRIDLTVGRGSSVDSFPLFGFAVSDYDRLFAEKLDLLLATSGSPGRAPLGPHWTTRSSYPGSRVDSVSGSAPGGIPVPASGPACSASRWPSGS